MSEIEALKALEASKGIQSTTATGAAGGTSKAASNRAAGGEMDPGKSTVKGSTDYFDGRSVITDADTVVDIAKIYDENHFSNVPPERMADKLKEKGYDVQVVKIGNRKAIQFKNGDLFVDSDGDGNLGTKDQNFQNALGAVEKKFGVDLHGLAASKYLSYRKESEIGKGKDPGKVTGVSEGGSTKSAGSSTSAYDPMDPYAMTGQTGTGQTQNLASVFAQLDTELAAHGYTAETASDLWQGGRLSPVLQELGIAEPKLPDASAALNMQRSLNLFGAAFGIASNRQEAL